MNTRAPELTTQGELVHFFPGDRGKRRNQDKMKLDTLVKYSCLRKISTILTFFVACITVLSVERILNYERISCVEPQVYRRDKEVIVMKSGLPLAPSQNDELFSVREATVDPLLIPYEHLVGSPPAKKRFLTIGISTVKRKVKNYLIDTIKSIFGHSNASELEEILLVLYVTNMNPADNEQMAKDIVTEFHPHVEAGRLIVISSSMRNYPTLEGLKRNFNDSKDRVKYRSKQNADYAFLVNYCTPLSEYYLMLEDDVVCAENFLTSIKKTLQDRAPSWTTISFSKLGYIGKLYHSKDLPKLARFLLMFYDEMPGDWLMEIFQHSKAQKEVIRIKPSLFQHVGVFSSFQALKRDAKDDEFAEFPINGEGLPLASCYTTLDVHEEYDAASVCKSGSQFFWGKNVEVGKFFLIAFQTPVDIKKIDIVTGSAEHPGDILYSGYVQFGRMKYMEDGIDTCKMFNIVGRFENGHFKRNTLDKAIGERVDCIRIQIAAQQKEWLIIKYVRL